MTNVVTNVERWSARSPAEWETSLAATHVGFDVRLPGDRFAGEITRTPLGVASLVECRSTPFTARRTRPVMNDEGAARIGVQVVRRGAERILRRGGEHVIAAGDLGIWDGLNGLGIEVLAPFAKRTLVLPRAAVLAVSPRMDDLGALPQFGQLAGARLLARYLDAVVAELAGMDDYQRATAGDVALELLRAAVEPVLPAQRAARREALRARARRYARSRLADPGLDPQGISRALAVSVRTLHAAFEGSGSSVASMVRTARLARCHQDLSNVEGGTVTEIALRWGFTDVTHFSQAFRREYGCAPREIRARNTRLHRTEPMA